MRIHLLIGSALLIFSAIYTLTALNTPVWTGGHTAAASVLSVGWLIGTTVLIDAAYDAPGNR